MTYYELEPFELPPKPGHRDFCAHDMRNGDPCRCQTLPPGPADARADAYARGERERDQKRAELGQGSGILRSLAEAAAVLGLVSACSLPPCQYEERAYPAPVFEYGQCYGLVAPRGGLISYFDVCEDESGSGFCGVIHDPEHLPKYYVSDPRVLQPFGTIVPCGRQYTCEELRRLILSAQEEQE